MSWIRLNMKSGRQHDLRDQKYHDALKDAQRLREVCFGDDTSFYTSAWREAEHGGQINFRPSEVESVEVFK